MNRIARPLLFLALALLAAMLVSIGVGSVFISPGEILRVLRWAFLGLAPPDGDTGKYRVILFTLRLPRTLLMVLTGAALAGSGAAYQGLFRNPLADPYLIGAASGAGLGAVIALSLNWPSNALGYLSVPLIAFLTALLTVFLVYQLARTGKTIPVTNLILAGVAVSSFATALTSFLMINTSGELRRALVWLLGGSTLAGWKPLLAQLPYTLVGLGVLLSMSYRLNVLQFGDEQATQLGVNVARSRAWIILAATLVTAAAVAFTGIIGFVGLVVPHIIRRLWGGDTRRVLPLSFMGGAIFLLAADILARVLMAPQELPVGIITSLFGAPFFLFILRQSKREIW
ncbi:MAG TPA: iron ABC transporter permease [Pelolinea sp.]|nr:iron ABC transporter permease [Pelolinea sp.]